MPRQPDLSASSEDWLVFADQLSNDGDPRGELIMLNHAIETGQSKSTADRDAFVEANADALLGPLAKYVGALRLHWRWLSVDRIELFAHSTDDAAAMAAILEAPFAQDLVELSIGGDPRTESDQIDLSQAIAAVVSRGLPQSCRTLSLVDGRAARSTSVIATFYDPPKNLVDFGDLGALWGALGHVTDLRISCSDAAQIQYGAIQAPSLEHFQVDCLTWGGRDDISNALIEASWPNLRSLALRLPETWTHSIADDDQGYTRPYADREDEYDDYYDEDDGYHDGFDWSRLRQLLATLKDKPLTRLALTSFESTQAVLDALADAKLPASLEDLDLSDSALDERAVEWMATHKDVVGRLKRLIVKKTPLSDADLGRLKEMIPEVVHSPGSGPTYRFLVGME